MRLLPAQDAKNMLQIINKNTAMVFVRFIELLFTNLELFYGIFSMQVCLTF